MPYSAGSRFPDETVLSPMLRPKGRGLCASVEGGDLMRTAALAQLDFRSAAAAWLESRRPYISPKTFHEYELNIKTLAAFFGEMRLPEIDGDQMRAYQKMRLTQCGPFGINHEGNVVCQMRARIGMPLMDYQALPLPKEKRGRALRDEERETLLKVASSNPNWEAAYLFAAISVNTSAGPKETSTLRLKDIDLQQNIILIQPGGAKNVHRIRRIPMNDESLPAVKLALARARRLGSVEPDHYLFPFRIHRAKFDPTRRQTTFKTAWKKLIVAAGLPGFRMYDLRHHAITVLLENPEVSDETAEAIAGHISREMKKQYSHIRIEARRAAVEALTPQKPKKKAPRAEKRNPQDAQQVAKQLIELLGKLLKTG